MDQTPEFHHVAHPKDKVSRMEDSLTYNNEPLIHLRNGGQAQHQSQRRHFNGIGEILQPHFDGFNDPQTHNANGTQVGNGNGHIGHHDTASGNGYSSREFM